VPGLKATYNPGMEMPTRVWLTLIRTRSKLAWLALTVLAGTLFLVAQPASSQTLQAPPERTKSDTALTSIPIENLPLESRKTNEMIRAIRMHLSADSTLLAIGALVPSTGNRVDSLCSRSENLIDSQPTLRRLRNLQSDWQGLMAEIDRWQNSLAGRISSIGIDLNQLARLRQTWQLTEASAGMERLPAEVVNGITRIVSEIEETEDLLFHRRSQLLLIEYQVGDLGTRCRNRINLASAEVENIRASLLVADVAPLWNPGAILEADNRLDQKLTSTLADHFNSLRTYARTEPARVGLHLAVFIVVAICIALLGKYAGAHSEGDTAMARAAEVLRNPIPAALLVAILMDGALQTSPPRAWVLLLNLLLLVPLLALVPRLLNPRIRSAVYILAGVYLVDGALEIMPQHSFVGRILRLAIKLTLIITALWLMRRLYLPRGRPPGGRRNLAALALGAGVCILAVSAVTGVVGRVSLATVLLDGTLESVYLGLLIWLTVVVLKSIVTVILKTGLIRRTNLVRMNGKALRDGILTALNVGGVLVWLAVTLDGFKLLGPTYQGLRRALASSFRIGSLKIAVADIALFILMVWLSFLISRILRAILREEVYPRVKLAHGVPMAISKLAHYAILLIGFFVALGAVGIDLNRFTLLAGALGVGIGFGLQNIVNNLVSGLIVLFERPVQIGDKVKIGTNEGEIKHIGLRATVIRTWAGAEVIVPNSRLVLDEVTNWTLSDQLRRIDVEVGVAYGSDTDKVSEVLLGVAKEHEDVLDYPEPAVIFTGFGDSSLNFSLRSWTNRFGDFLRVGSDLTSAVNKALAEAGITIPFPQRDVHMKSDDKPPEHESPGADSSKRG